MMKWYVKRSNPVQAEQWNGVTPNDIWGITGVFTQDNTPYLHTKTGVREVRKGDYIIKAKNEALAIMPKEEFEAQYVKTSKRSFKVHASTDIYLDAYNEEDALYKAKILLHNQLPQTIHFDLETGYDDE